MRAKQVDFGDGQKGVSFVCPGCGDVHAVRTAPVPDKKGTWGFNGDFERPTLTPSLNVTTGHFAGQDKAECWCTYNAQHPDEPADFVCYRCHSIVVNGRIEFCGDSTHAMKGKTVDLPEIQ